MNLDSGPIRSDTLIGISEVHDLKEQTENNNERHVNDTSHGMNGSIKPSFHVFRFKTAVSWDFHWCCMGCAFGKKNQFLSAQLRTDH